MQSQKQQQTLNGHVDIDEKDKSPIPVQYPLIKSLKHFAHQMPLPQTVRIFSYCKKTQSKKKKKLKDKFENFKYYENLETKQIHKILFVTDDLYVDQGTYPFTQPTGQLKDFTQLVNAKRLSTTEAAYIGHLDDCLIVKKMQGVKLGENGTEFQTNNDDFQLIKINNQTRFNQFLKLMSLNPNSISMSIRVIIDQSQKQPQVIDYEFFYREKELSKKHQVNTNKNTNIKQ